MTHQITNAEVATDMLEHIRDKVEGYFYNLRDEELTSDDLFEMRISLQDMADDIAIACKHIEQYQREVEATETNQ